MGEWIRLRLERHWPKDSLLPMIKSNDPLCRKQGTRERERCEGKMLNLRLREIKKGEARGRTEEGGLISLLCKQQIDLLMRRLLKMCMTHDENLKHFAMTSYEKRARLIISLNKMYLPVG
jgi:hypothetical protein